MKYEHIIWDFNGTILDDVETGILSVNKLLRDRGLPEIESKEQYRELFRFPIKGYYERLGFDFSKEPYEVIAPIWVEQYLINVKNAEVFPDVKDALERLHGMGIKQTVLSATERNMLIYQLRELGIDGYFDEIMGLDNIHASSKLSLAMKWKEMYGNCSALMIGDTDHDLETAKAMGVDCVLLSRGHQSKKYLASLGAKTFDEFFDLYVDIIQ